MCTDLYAAMYICLCIYAQAKVVTKSYHHLCLSHACLHTFSFIKRVCTFVCRPPMIVYQQSAIQISIWLCASNTPITNDGMILSLLSPVESSTGLANELIDNNLAPTGSVSNTVWNIFGEFQQSEADWTRCTKPQWKDLPDLVILFPPSAVYMRRWIWSALIRVMVSRLFGAKHYLNQCWFIINWTLGNKLQWNCNWNSNTFIEDRFENVVCNFHVIMEFYIHTW